MTDFFILRRKRMFKQKLDTMIGYPAQFSGFIALYGLLIFLPLIRPPVFITFVLVTLLVWLSMFFGRVLAPLKDKNTNHRS